MYVDFQKGVHRMIKKNQKERRMNIGGMIVAVAALMGVCLCAFFGGKND